MPYAEHRAVRTPDQDALKTWRFMDFTKFVSLIEESALFFANLATFADPLEGYLSKPTVARISHVPEGLSAEARRKWQLGTQSQVHFHRSGRRDVLVSCWHLNEYESAAMWDLYARKGQGIAIRSTIGRMKRAFEAVNEVVFIRQVEYVDYDKEEVPTGNMLYLPLHKRKSFEHERELRAMIMALGENTPGKPVELDLHKLLERVDAIPGKPVAVDLNELVERVFVAPNSPVWIHELINMTALHLTFRSLTLRFLGIFGAAC